MYRVCACSACVCVLCVCVCVQYHVYIKVGTYWTVYMHVSLNAVYSQLVLLNNRGGSLPMFWLRLLVISQGFSPEKD